MINFGLKIAKFYVRVFMKTTKGDTYMTLGPYEERKANNLVHEYLSTGICSWVEKVV
tara:strand:- start:77 stop:247 length:171 start_codon:yes stop_codon:yes gene_type:complete